MKRYIFLLVISVSASLAQWSGSGSNGSDGALNLGANTPGVVNGRLTFDPVALNLDADGDNIYHFTTITIRDFLAVDFRANKMRHPGPVVFLATGAVNLQGNLNFSGEEGHPSDSNEAVRRPSVPGPGGFPGGSGARVGSSAAMPGLGPGGGKAASFGCPGAFVTNATPSWCASAGPSVSYGNTLLQPLVGGSGGSGGSFAGQNFGPGGGAGGGAIRIVSDVHIVFGTGANANGAATGCSSSFWIAADGGYGSNPASGAGAGGAIHLQAPLIAGCALHLYVRGGAQPSFGSASPGRVRIDANNVVGGVTSTPVAALIGELVNVPLPASPARIRITSINGVAAPANPNYLYTTPDVSTNAPGAVPVVIEAANVPVGTPITVFLTSEGGADVASAQVNLTGSLASSNATINVTLPQGVTRLLARAVW